MINENECQYKDKLASGEVLLQKIEAFVINYECDTIKETVETYQTVLECDAHDKAALQPFKRTVGYIAGTINKQNEICIRMSFCIPNDFHRFNAEAGKNLAISKLFIDQDKCNFMTEHDHNACDYIMNGEGVVYVMPYTLREVYEYFQKRCVSYFKGCQIEVNSFMMTAENE